MGGRNEGRLTLLLVLTTLVGCGPRGAAAAAPSPDRAPIARPSAPPPPSRRVNFVIDDSQRRCDGECWRRRRTLPERSCEAVGARWPEAEAALEEAIEGWFAGPLSYRQGQSVRFRDAPRPSLEELQDQKIVILRVTRSAGWFKVFARGGSSYYCVDVEPIGDDVRLSVRIVDAYER